MDERAAVGAMTPRSSRSLGEWAAYPSRGVAGGQSPAVRSEAFVMFGVTDAVGAVHKREVTHFAEVIGAILVFSARWGSSPRNEYCAQNRGPASVP